jgi:agmatine/peptidylarginine deiminase
MKADFSKCKKLFLSYPRGFKNEYETLVSFYDQLIELIPSDINLVVIVNTKKAEQYIKATFRHKSNLETVIVNYWDEIWLRDCMGLAAADRVIKPIYSPKYCTLSNENKYFEYLNKLVSRILSNTITTNIIDMPLNIDGGNFVHNTKTVFLTEKVIEDNPGKDVRQVIKNYTNLEAIIVDRNYYDVLGHLDGYMAFKDESTLFISEYPNLSYLKQDTKYVKELKLIAENAGFNVVPIFDRPIDEPVHCSCKGKKTRSCLYSARGVYVNYIRFNNYIIMPEYSIPKNSEIEYNWTNRKLFESYGFEVLNINCDLLSKLGGSLHCISFQY